MSVGAFTDKKQQPTEAEIQRVMGAGLSYWEELVQYVRQQYAPDEEFRFMYGKKYGWALRFQMRGKLLTSFYPTNGGLTVQINLGPAAIEQALEMRLGEHVVGVINRATAYSEGRWLFIPVKSPRDIQDIQRLIALRVKTKRLA
ncbi:MAG: DUF3788 family protein [Anaerolineales bacterium]